MSPEEILAVVKAGCGEAIVDAVAASGHPYVVVSAQRWPTVALFLRDDPRLLFNCLRCITSLDLIADNKLACVYDLMHIPADTPGSLATNTRQVAVRVVVDRESPEIPSVADVWSAADWHEREAFDLMGIRFANHPDLRRILCPDDWVGYPLRKDYEFPLEYEGIPATTEYELPNPRH